MNQVTRKPPLPWTPASRGSLTDLVKKPSEFAVIAPESPRPTEMLSRVTVCEGVPDLTPLDQATHELLLSMAFETDPSMQQEVYSINLKALVRYLGRDIRKEDVARSIKKLRQITVNFDSEDQLRRYEDVRLIDMWRSIEGDDLSIEYSFPFPIRQLMRRMPRYAHLELAVLADGLMSTRWGPALYKHLLLASKAKEWQPGGENEIIVQMTPEEVADAVDFPRVGGKLNVSKLTDFIAKTVTDLKKVRRFQTIFDPKSKDDVIHETGRGRRVRYYKFRVRLNPPRPQFLRGGMISEVPGIGAKDAPEYQVSSGVWEKANFLYDRRSAFWGWGPNHFRDLWLMALAEALDGQPMTEGYSTRMYRGPALLAAIQEKGADFAAWLLLGEEDRDPNLRELVTRPRQREANVARANRLKTKSKTLRNLHRKDIADVEKKIEVAQAAADLIDDIPFLTCRKATLELGKMGAEHFESAVEQAIHNRTWTGDRRFLLAVKAGDNTATFRINPTADEWDALVLGYNNVSEGLSYE
ncbi:hypothetical protein ELI15_14020 [Rhizobium ruizarguesonis]|uniref:hypothetical protein n=1 Tax=Rhizobium ruizarguesonis TaxID=2081791 RepID=UPI001031294E|nr:hypothetical protein [Rhizobium ruizarguesonis]TAW65406.1 hypothetical protein ELI15_14020 [Rhizobium ruizarguesonis]